MNKLLPSGPLMEQPIPGIGRLGNVDGMVVVRASLEIIESEIIFLH